MTDTPKRHTGKGKIMTHEPLIEVIRNGRTESVHYGSLVVLGADGSERFALGDVDTAGYPRSTAKIMQATGLVRLGLDLPPELLALAVSSHSGEEFHLEGVRRILGAAGLTEADLANPESLPLEEKPRDEWIAAGRSARKLAHCCSGKPRRCSPSPPRADGPLWTTSIPDIPSSWRWRTRSRT